MDPLRWLIRQVSRLEEDALDWVEDHAQRLPPGWRWIAPRRPTVIPALCVLPAFSRVPWRRRSGRRSPVGSRDIAD